MVKRATIPPRERDAAEEAAIRSVRDMLGYETGYVNPRLGIGDMSELEMRKIVQAAVSGWQVQRSRDLVGDRIFDEHEFMATGEIPEPYELGPVAFALPAMADWLEKMELGGVAFINWRKSDATTFAWTVWDLVQRANTIRDERPSTASDVDDLAMLRAG